jgi:hypothetical protein
MVGFTEVMVARSPGERSTVVAPAVEVEFGTGIRVRISAAAPVFGTTHVLQQSRIGSALFHAVAQSGSSRKRVARGDSVGRGRLPLHHRRVGHALPVAGTLLFEHAEHTGAMPRRLVRAGDNRRGLHAA